MERGREEKGKRTREEQRKNKEETGEYRLLRRFLSNKIDRICLNFGD